MRQWADQSDSDDYFRSVHDLLLEESTSDDDDNIDPWEDFEEDLRREEHDDDDVAEGCRRSDNNRSLPLLGGTFTAGSAAISATMRAAQLGASSDALDDDDLLIPAGRVGRNAAPTEGTKGVAVPPPLGGEATAASQA